jgi:hypothetical protein
MKKFACIPFVAIWLVMACTSSAQQDPRGDMPKGSNVNPDAKLVADFNARVKEYADLRKDLAAKSPPLKETASPTEIETAEKGLAAQIRAARANVKRGAIFTPAAEAMFRRLLSPAVKGAEGAENKALIKDDAPPPAEIPFKVNAEYPKDQPLSSVPPDVLQRLPQLPEYLQYRFTGKHLLLYCSRGNLIVDYMMNAIP